MVIGIESSLKLKFSTCGQQCIIEERMYKITMFEDAKIDYIAILKIIRYWFSNVLDNLIAELLGIDNKDVTMYLKKSIDSWKENTITI